MIVDTIAASDLSDRELEVLREIIRQKTNKQIAQKLRICEKTVEFHARNIYRKLNVKNRFKLILMVGRNIEN